MITASVFYPAGPGSTFDMGYYLSKHIPMVREKVGAALKGVRVEKGLAGGGVGMPPPYAAAAHLSFDSVESFQAAFSPHIGAFLQDVPNYTNVQPVLQISEVVAAQ